MLKNKGGVLGKATTPATILLPVKSVDGRLHVLIVLHVKSVDVHLQLASTRPLKSSKRRMQVHAHLQLTS